MKNVQPTIICILMLCYVTMSAQSYIEPTDTNKEKTTSHLLPLNNPMPDWEKHWTRESVKAINEIIDQYGYPDENSATRMYWIIPGKIKRTITYTENFLFDLPFETNTCNKDSVALSIKNHL
ncbi:hypothetical protein [Planktosalinus lacus]|uniref:Uncharacterized protein n=1 Tax=Planktosalinus lacus TaxID=1526573 RepID=A0A8J2Y9X0_9FLAO|nr:hypothetical protein [Planktosalinus lacus]GGE01444.1 hypothetical protein GCM10011312_26130 [Planktosalinus lacus]